MSADLPLFRYLDRSPIRFDGSSYSSKNDEARLTTQLLRVFDCMKSGAWKTLAEIQVEVGGSEAGVSARLRDLRKKRNGSHTVNKRHRGDPKRGVYEYRLEVKR